MPELPEVETTIRGLQVIVNLKIFKVQIHTQQLRFKIPNAIKKKLLKSKISNIRRIAKYIILDLDNKYSIIIHLGMSGRLKTKTNKIYRNKHDHFVVLFNKNKSLIFNDPRKFGFVDLAKKENLIKKTYIMNLGLDALDNQMNHQYLYSKIFKSSVPIKQILLNQKIIAGIGNIYASEILYDAKISPFRPGKKLKISKLMILIISIKKILKKAIKYGGSSISDYRSPDGTLGNFQSNFMVYNKEGRKINNDVVKRTIQYGRSTFYCPNLQK